MEIARGAIGLSPGRYRLDPALKEISFGAWEGLTWPEIEARDPSGVRARRKDKWSFTPPGGESYATLAERLRPWLSGLTGDAFVVSHGGVARALMTLIAGRRAGQGRRRADRSGPRAVVRERGLSLDQVKAPRLTSAPAPRPKAAPSAPVSPAIIFLVAAACGLIVANIYYAQPLIGPIAQSLGLAPQAAGLIVTMTQIGYGAGLLFIVPLGDLIENRRLLLACVSLSAFALAAAAFAPSAAVFLICAGAIGLGSVAVQILVPLAAHLAPDATRGRVVGMVSSGLMIGIMLARPVSSFIAAQSSWRVVFVASAAMMVALVAVLARALPVRMPDNRMTYGALIASMGASPPRRRFCVGGRSTRLVFFSALACSGRRRRYCSPGRTID